MTHLNSRVARIVAGLAVVTAFAVAPMAAQAADTDTTGATGTLTGGSLNITSPADISAINATLGGITQIVTADVGAWSANDATGSNDGYNITLTASAPTVGGVGADAGTGATLTLGASTTPAAPGTDNPVPAASRPVNDGDQVLPATGGATIDHAILGMGQGLWDFAAVSAANDGLSVVIPGDASAGAYSSTLTYTIATLVTP